MATEWVVADPRWFILTKPKGCGTVYLCRCGDCLPATEVACVWCGATGYGKECPPCEVKHEGQPLPSEERKVP